MVSLFMTMLLFGKLNGPTALPGQASGVSTGSADTPFITLNDAWRAGLSAAFSIAGAEDALRAAKILEFQTRSQFFPKITPTYMHSPNARGWSIAASQALPYFGGQLRAEHSTTTYEGVPAVAPRTTDTSFTWSQPLLRGAGPNASLYDLRNSRRNRVAQERNLTLARQRYMVDVARVFYQTQAQRELLRVARQSAERSAALRKASEARLEVGLSNKLDVYRAQLSESQAEQSSVQADTSLQSALENFRFLLGRAPNDSVEPAPVEIPLPGADDAGPLDALIAAALEARLDLAEVRDQIDDARRTASLSRQNLLPDVSLNLRYAEMKFGGTTIARNPTDRRWESFFSASLPLQRAADISQLQLSNLEVAARQRAYEQKRFEVESEARSAHRALISLSRSIATQRSAVDIADQQLRLANLRYQRGLASNFDVVDAEGSLLAARSSLVQLLAAYQVARLDIERVVGRLNTNLEPRP
ncbi:MAG: TolC family protein [Vicinamibacteria bacterium]